MEADYFLLRGKEKTTGEFALLSLGYNLQRALNLFGFQKVLQAMVCSLNQRSLLLTLFHVLKLKSVTI